MTTSTSEPAVAPDIVVSPEFINGAIPGSPLTIIVGLASLPYVLAFLTLAIVFGVALSVAAVGLEELTFRRYHRTSDLVRLFWLAVAENVGYRQLNSWWRIRGMISVLRGKHEWGELQRKGFAASE